MSITDDQTLLHQLVLNPAQERTLTETSEGEPSLADEGPLSSLFDGTEGPATLNHYVLLSKLGEGGMGVVYAAFDQKLDRKVALKLLRASGDDKARRRLVREAQSLAKLSNPNVVQIYEIGEAEGLVYIVMEFVSGLTLRDWILDQPRAQTEILAVFAAAGRGLAAAHARGLVHRDFKPDNVMIREDGRVLVMDFGLAQPDPEDEDELPSIRDNPVIEPSGLTATGVLLGTPAYMAPEQFEHRPTDARTDQFSFCVTLWEALHGRRPFEADNLMELSAAVCSGSLTVPEHSEVPSWLRKLLARGLEVEPEHRWPSLEALLEALRRDPTQRRRAFVATLASVAVTLAALASVALVRERAATKITQACSEEGAALAWTDERALAVEQLFEATDLAYAPAAWTRTRALLDDYADSWSTTRTQACLETRVDHERDEDEYASVARCLDERRANFEGLLEAWTELEEGSLAQATRAAASLPPVDTCVSQLWLNQRVQPPVEHQATVARLRGQLERAKAMQAAARYADGLPLAQAATDEALSLGWRPLVAEARLCLADLQDKLGDYELARTTGRQAYLDAIGSGHELAALDVAMFMAPLVGDHIAEPELGQYWGSLTIEYVERLGLQGTVREAEALNGLGTALSRAGEYTEALAVHVRARAIFEELLGPEHIFVANSINSYGNSLRETGDFEGALASFRVALERRARLLGPHHPIVATSHNNIGVIHWEQGNYAGALHEFRTALELREAALGPEHPNVGTAHNNVGAVLATSGSYAEALVSFRRALEIQEATVGHEHPDVAGTLTNMAAMLRYEGDIGAALAMHERALAIWEASYGPEHPNVALALNNIGISQDSLGRYEQSLATHERALAIREAALGPEHPEVAQSLGNIASQYSALGKLDEALALQRRALELREAALGPEHPDVATSLSNIALVLRERGDFDEALAMQLRALAIYETTMGPEGWGVANTLLEIGLSLLGLERLDEAHEQVQRAMAMVETGDAELTPREQAEVRFALARVEWARGEQDRARASAAAAREQLFGIEGLEASGEELLVAVEAWQAEHP